MLSIIGLIIGVLIFGAGLYYLIKEKNDPESKKIYSIISIIGAVLIVICGLMYYWCMIY